jgi:hypothetical protein
MRPRVSLALVIVLLTGGSLGAPSPSGMLGSSVLAARNAPVARPADVGSLDAIIAALYDVISGPAGQRRDWDRMRTLFVPGARLIPTGRRADTAAIRMMTVDEYITGIGPQLEKSGFFERHHARLQQLRQPPHRRGSRAVCPGDQQHSGLARREAVVDRDDLLGKRAA